MIIVLLFIKVKKNIFYNDKMEGLRPSHDKSLSRGGRRPPLERLGRGDRSFAPPPVAPMFQRHRLS